MNAWRYVKWFFLFTAFIVSAISFGLPKSNGYDIIWLIPLTYMLLLISLVRLAPTITESAGIKGLQVILYIKYVVATLIIVLSQDYTYAVYTGITPSAESNIEAIIVTIVEMVAIFITLHIFAPFLYKSKARKNNENLNISPVPVGLPLILFGTLCVTLAFLFKDLLIPNEFLFITHDYVKPESDIAFDGLVLMMFHAFKLILAGIIINKLVRLFQNTPRFRYVFLAYLTIASYIVLSTSTSRTNMVIPFMLFVMITYRYFKRKSLFMLIAIAPLIIASTITVTLYKHDWVVASSSADSPMIAAGDAMIKQIQEYTSGIRPTALGIEASKKYSYAIDGQTFFNDIIGSIPFASSLIDQRDRINVYYNMYVLGPDGANTSLIMPLSAISRAYFKPPGSWIITSLFILILLYVDSRPRPKNIIEHYLQAYIIFVLVVSVYSNTQMVVGRLATLYLPALVIIHLNKSLTLKRSKINE